MAAPVRLSLNKNDFTVLICFFYTLYKRQKILCLINIYNLTGLFVLQQFLRKIRWIFISFFNKLYTSNILNLPQKLHINVVTDSDTRVIITLSHIKVVQ